MGTYTIRQALAKTYKSPFKTRFEYRKRDSVRVIRIQRIHTLTWRGKKRQLGHYFEIVSQSIPKYYTYTKHSKKEGIRRVVTRRVKHQYDIFFRIDTLSIDDKSWQVYLGSAQRWDPKPPQEKLKTIYRENLKKWDIKKIRKHRRGKQPYIDVGDYNAQVKGINGDFRFRCCYVYEKFGHLFHKRGIRLSATEIKKPPVVTNKKQTLFLPKHLISFFETLIRKGYLK